MGRHIDVRRRFLLLVHPLLLLRTGNAIREEPTLWFVVWVETLQGASSGQAVRIW